MNTEAFHDFLVASGGVAGALIGLLFVAISVAPGRLQGEDSSQAHRVRASTALTVFTNALSISLFGLIPDVGMGWTTVAVGAVGVAFVLGSLMSLLRIKDDRSRQLRDATFLVGIVVIFGYQIWLGLRLETDHHDATSAMRGISVTVVACFLVGIARAWELVGGPSIRLRREVIATLRAAGDDEDHG